MSEVTLDEVKRRMAEKAAPPPPPPEEKKPTLRPETVAELRQFEQAQAEYNKQAMAAEQKVDLGPLPEGVVVADGPKDTTYYRGNSYDNPAVRKSVESRCSEMDFADLVLTGRVSQTVPVIPKKLTFEFQSLLGNESYWVESRAQMEAATDWGVRGWMVYAQLTMALTSVNGRELPSHLNKAGDVDPELFKAKLDKVMRLGAKIIDIAVTNMNWFNSRVDDIFKDDFESLKNG